MSAAVSWVKRGADKLRSAEIPDLDAMRESEMLLAKSFDCARWQLYLKESFNCPDFFLQQFERLVEKRALRFPLQYLLERVPFMNSTLHVDTRCLIPRPETELLVERICAVLNASGKNQRVLDLGTGSGNIAISLAQEFETISVVGTDISEEALEVARGNAERNGVQNRIQWVLADCFEGIENARFDLIVSNPPYLSQADFNRIQPELFFEPRTALDGGKDGLTFFRKIVYNAGNFLKQGGSLFLEVGDGQARQVNKLLRENGFFRINTYPDYQGIDRIVSGVKNG